MSQSVKGDVQFPDAAVVLRAMEARRGEGVPGYAWALNPILSLARNHEMQWDAEDECRAGVTDEIRGRLKARIDGLNSLRAKLIEEIDHCLADSLLSEGSAPLHTETYGMLIDRIAIAWVRLEKVRASKGLGSDVARRANVQLVELSMGYDILVSDIVRGVRRFPRWTLLKSYGVCP